MRDLQAPAALDQLLGRLMTARQKLVDAGGPSRPIVVKIAPDVAEEDLEPIVDRMLAHKVDGIAVGNTTLSRKGLLDADVGREAGGLSGPPLFHRSTAMLARVYRLTHGRVPLIGIGGIESGETALAKIEAGATLIQLYTGLIFEGPALIGASSATSPLPPRPPMSPASGARRPPRRRMGGKAGRGVRRTSPSLTRRAASQ